MKKILIHYPILNVGGAERSTIRLINLMLSHQWHVHLVVTTGGGKLESELDPRVKVTRLRTHSAGAKFKNADGWIKKSFQLPDLVVYLYSRIQQAFRSLHFLSCRYDCAMISLHGTSPAFVCKWVKTDKRFQWIRNDLSRIPDKSKMLHVHRYGNKIDNYLCVSNTAATSFRNMFPIQAPKARVIHNVLNFAEMKRKAQESLNPYPEQLCGLKVVTVCRLQDDSKAVFRMVEAHRILHQRGLRFHWFVVGDGPDREELSKRIAKARLTDWFNLVGYKQNPFPYYRFADLSATLSNYEGLCGTINEAKASGTAAIATRFSGIEEQIDHGSNGWIVDNGLDAVVDGLQLLLTDHELRHSITNNWLPDALQNDEAKLSQIIQLIDS